VSLLPHPITTPTSVAPGVSLIGVW
jgi:hypothetical protein